MRRESLELPMNLVCQYTRTLRVAWYAEPSGEQSAPGNTEESSALTLDVVVDLAEGTL